MNKPSPLRRSGAPNVLAAASGAGKVEGIWIKPERTSAFLSVAEVRAMADAGLEGDIHSDPVSPRQLLLASSIAYQDLGLPEYALRENLRIDLDTAYMQSGQLLKIGGEVLIEVTFQCEACNRLNEVSPGLARIVAGRRGILARVVHGGTIKRGDQVTCVGNSGSRWSDRWQDRVALVLARMPKGYVIEYGQLARRAGIDTSYCRAFPNLLKQLDEEIAMKAVSANGEGIRWDGVP